MVAKRYWLCVFALCLGATFVLSYQVKWRDPSRASLRDQPRTLTRSSVGRSVAARNALTIPIAFEPSGAVSGGAQLVARGKKMAVALTRDGIELRAGLDASGRSEIASLRFLMDRATGSRLVWRGVRKLRGESNYFIGNDRTKWRTHIPRFERAEANAGGIGIAVYGNGEGIEYDLRVGPEVKLSRLRLDYGYGRCARGRER